MPRTVRSNPIRCGKPQIPGQQCRFTWRYSRGGILTGSWCVSCHRNVTKTLKRSKIHVSCNITDSTQRQQRPHADCGSQNLFTLVWAHFPEWTSHAISAKHWVMIVKGGFVKRHCVKSNLTWWCSSLSSKHHIHTHFYRLTVVTFTVTSSSNSGCGDTQENTQYSYNYWFKKWHKNYKEYFYNWA